MRDPRTKYRVHLTFQAVDVRFAPVSPIMHYDTDRLFQRRRHAIELPPRSPYRERMPDELMHPEQQALRPDPHRFPAFPRYECLRSLLNAAYSSVSGPFTPFSTLILGSVRCFPRQHVIFARHPAVPVRQFLELIQPDPASETVPELDVRLTIIYPLLRHPDRGNIRHTRMSDAVPALGAYIPHLIPTVQILFHLPRPS